MVIEFFRYKALDLEVFSMLKIDLHVHSICSDGLNTINEICNFARKKQLKAVAITDHGPGLLPWHISKDYFYLLGRLAPHYKTKKSSVLLGIETNIIDQHGKLDLSIIAEAACKYKKLLELNEVHLGKRLDDEKFILKFKKAVNIIVENDWYLFCGSDGHDFCEIAQDYNIRKATNIFKIPKKNIINNNYNKLLEFLNYRQNEKKFNKRPSINNAKREGSKYDGQKAFHT